jgi:amino acid permease
LAYLSLHTITKVGSPIGSGVVMQSGKPGRYTITAAYMRNIFPVSVIYDVAPSFITLSSCVKQPAL